MFSLILINVTKENLNTSFDKRENFDDDIDFDIIFTRNICFFDVANKANLIKIFDEIKNEINNEITNDFEDFCEKVTNNTRFLDVNFASFVANFF